MKASDYLIKKLETLGIEEVFGLPGDFNFKIIESVLNNKNINWVGSTNELNAGYAADGYARIKGYSAIITTFGVGELSAINAIAGSMAENNAVLKIVGVPKTKHIKNNTLLHHNIVDTNNKPNYKAFYDAYKNVVQKAFFLYEKNIKNSIDNAIDTLIKYKKPVYIALPVDVCDMEIKENEKDFVLNIPKSDKKAVEKAADMIIETIKKSKNPMILADILTKRFDGKAALNSLLQRTNMISCALLRGAGIIEYNTKNYLGIYGGTLDNKKAYNMLNTSDCIIEAGCVISDLNTMNFSYKSKGDIIIQPHFTIVKGKKFDNIELKDILEALAQKINYIEKKEIINDFCYKKTDIKASDKLSCDYIYSKLQDFLNDNDIFVTEVGLIPFGQMPMKLPNSITIENQMLWGSIGWATGAAEGCAFASKNEKRRTILVTGDGSHQLTAQEISTMMRYGLKPIIFVINNSGYSVERILCDDVDYEYNNIAHWDYSLLPKVFKGDCYVANAKTNADFDKALKEIEKENEDKMCYIELFTDYLDIPYLAKGIVK